MSLSKQRVTELFMEYLPADVSVSFEEPREYVTGALLNPFVQLQVRIGIYDEWNIWQEFLGVAKSIVILKQVVVCLPLLHNLLEGLDSELVEGYVRYVAAHEAHHFEHGHGFASDDPRAQAHRERECNDLIQERYPELEVLKDRAENESIIIQRVYSRIRSIKEASLV